MGAAATSLRPGFLHVLGASAEEWAERHGIEPFAHPCGMCGAVLETSIPFTCREGPGLVAPACECGNVLTPYCVLLRE